MILKFLLIYIILGILIYLMFRLLKKAVEKITDQSKSYYIKKLQEYDELIDSKEEQLDQLNEEIKNKKVEIENVKYEDDNDKVDFDVSIIDLLNRTNYKDNSALDIEKIIEEKFNYNSEKIIKNFISKMDTSKNYEFCKKLKKKFNAHAIYEYKLLSQQEMFEKFEKTLNEKELDLVENYKKTRIKFKLDEFVTFLDELIEINNPQIVVYVGNKKENYDYLNKYVKTKLDSSIYKGIKILYQSKIYDFSLNGRNM